MTYETPIMNLLLTQLLRNLHHVSRDAGGSCKPRDPTVTSNPFLAPPPDQPLTRTVHRERVVGCIDEPIPALHTPNLPLRLVFKAIYAWGARAYPAGVKTEHIISLSNDCAQRAPHRDCEERAGPPRASRIEEDSATMSRRAARGCGNTVQRDGGRACVRGVRVVEREKEASALLPFKTG